MPAISTSQLYPPFPPSAEWSGIGTLDNPRKLATYLGLEIMGIVVCVLWEHWLLFQAFAHVARIFISDAGNSLTGSRAPGLSSVKATIPDSPNQGGFLLFFLPRTSLPSKRSLAPAASTAAKIKNKIYIF